MDGGPSGAAEYIALTEWLQDYTVRIAHWWSEGYDLLLTPTMGGFLL
jgi:hypothetical protein